MSSATARRCAAVRSRLAGCEVGGERFRTSVGQPIQFWWWARPGSRHTSLASHDGKVTAPRESGWGHGYIVVAMTGPADRSAPTPIAQDPDATVVFPAYGQSPPTEPPPATRTIQTPETGSVARNSAVMAAGSIVSRITGLSCAPPRSARRSARASSATTTSSRSCCRRWSSNCCVGGVLSSVIVPVLVRTRKHDADARPGVRATAADPRGHRARCRHGTRGRRRTGLHRDPHHQQVSQADQALITKLSYLVLPAIFFYGMAALFAALLNTRGHFAAPMWTPILNNVVVIATAGVFIADQRRPTRRRSRSPPPNCSCSALGTTARHRRAGHRSVARAAPGRVSVAVAVRLPRSRSG